MKHPIEIQIPLVPNFLLAKDTKTPYLIADFTEDELREIGAKWVEALVEKARRKSTS